MLKIGLTGGIGCGKSTVTTAFKNKGIEVIDADVIAREVVAAGSPALVEIEQAFGSEIIDTNGSLDRSALKKQVFSDNGKLEQLENILHPRIRSKIEAKIKQHELDKPDVHYLIVDVPLLIEKNYFPLFDQIVVVDCTPEQQFERVIKRDGMNPQTLESIINKQISRNKRLLHADHILDNSRSERALLQQINSLHTYLISPSH